MAHAPFRTPFFNCFFEVVAQAPEKMPSWGYFFEIMARQRAVYRVNGINGFQIKMFARRNFLKIISRWRLAPLCRQNSYNNGVFRMIAAVKRKKSLQYGVSEGVCAVTSKKLAECGAVKFKVAFSERPAPYESHSISGILVKQKYILICYFSP